VAYFCFDSFDIISGEHGTTASITIAEPEIKKEIKKMITLSVDGQLVAKNALIKKGSIGIDRKAYL